MARPPAPCGTDAAYRRHLRRSEKPCTPCLDAHRAETARYRKASAPKTAEPVPVVVEPDEVSKAEVLREQRDTLRVALKQAAAEAEYSAVSSMSKELRAVQDALDALVQPQPEGVRTLADELAAARAAREARAAG